MLKKRAFIDAQYSQIQITLSIYMYCGTHITECYAKVKRAWEIKVKHL